jgi:hypothetical protein
MLTHVHVYTSEKWKKEQFQDAKGVIRSCKLKDRQCNGRKKEEKQGSTNLS